MKKIKDIINYVDNGYGLFQAMREAKVDMAELLSLMKENNELDKKLRKRFGDEAFEEPEAENESETEEASEDGEQEPEEDVAQGEAEQTQEPAMPANDGDSPELASLKQEAKELGISFNPNIGYEKLKARVDEFKAKQQ